MLLQSSAFKPPKWKVLLMQWKALLEVQLAFHKEQVCTCGQIEV